MYQLIGIKLFLYSVPYDYMITLTSLSRIDYFRLRRVMHYIYGHIQTATITRTDEFSPKSCTAAITNVKHFL